MYIVFSDETDHSLPTGKKIPVTEASKLLTDLNQALLDVNKEETLSYQLYSDKNDYILGMEVVLPEPHFTLYGSIAEKFKGELNEDAEALLHGLKDELTSPNKTEKKIKKKKKPFSFPTKWAFFSVLPLLLLVFLNGKINTQQEQLEELKAERIEQPQSTEDSKIDTFSRYFLSSYYTTETNGDTYRKGLTTYVEEKVLTSFEPTNKQLKSTLLWTIESLDEEIIVTYIISLKENEQSSTKKVRFTLTPNKQGEYKVKEAPSLEPFELKLTLEGGNKK